MAFASDDADRFLVGEDFAPAYLSLGDDELERRLEGALAELAACHACPRGCGVDRMADERDLCATGRYALVSSAFPHFGEEDVLRGSKGSGTIFFSRCNLRCVFCQNWDISQGRKGSEMTADQIAELMLDLQGYGCHNINFVTPEHVAPQVVEACVVAIRQGLRIPIVYNTSGYDAVSTLKLLDGIVDIYMPDVKVFRRESARRLLKAKDYPERAREAIAEMHRQVGPLRMGADRVARRGVLIRHLVMPEHRDDTAAIMRWLAEALSPDTYVNIMGQYHPDHQVGSLSHRGAPRYVEIARRPDAGEMRAAYAAAREAGLHRFDRPAP